MPISLEKIISSMNWAAQNGLGQVTLSFGSARIKIVRNGMAQSAPRPDAPEPRPAPTAPAPGAAGVTAPLAGTVYLSPEPGGPRFARTGDRVAAGQTLCLIEAMKMMAPVTAPQAGTVGDILVEDGAAVDAGAILMRVL